MSKVRFAEESKQEAVRQVAERGYTVPDVAKRLGVSVQDLYKRVKAYALSCPLQLRSSREFSNKIDPTWEFQMLD